MPRFRPPAPFRRPSRPTIHPSRAPQRLPRRRAWGTPSHLVLALFGLTLFFATLLLGIVVIGDNPTRSSLMAGLVVLIAAVGYVAGRKPVTRDE